MENRSRVFSILKEKIDGIEKVKLLCKSTGEYVSIIPSFGANVNELVLMKNGKLQKLLDGNKDLAAFDIEGIYNSAKLFPFPNRIKDGKYNFNGNKYYLPLNYQKENNACHGFIYDKQFEIIDSKMNEIFIDVTFQYEYDGAIKGFPFPFIIQLTYTLSKKDGFICKTFVKNISDSSFPMGDGWHPFIYVNKNIDNIHLKFLAEEVIQVDDHFIPTGKRKPYNKFNLLSKIGSTHFDTCFRLEPNLGIHSTEIYNKENDINISLWQEVGNNKYNYLQIYTPPIGNSIAIEPMTCNVNSFNNGDGLIILNPNETYSAKYGIKIT